MIIEIFKNIILNVSLLVLIAYLLTKMPLVRDFIGNQGNKLYAKLAMAVIFGLIGILSTYTGIQVEGAIANTRVIGVVAGGILGGPLVGLAAGLIAGIHRYAIDVGGFTALACALSTITEGLIGGFFSHYIKRRNNDWGVICAVTVLAEVAQMAIILLVARPFEQAWHLVQIISLPMILFNSLGVSIFIGIFDSVFIEQDREAASRIRLVMRIADQCLPYLRKGLNDQQNLQKATDIILKETEVCGVLMTDRYRLLSCAGKELKPLLGSTALPQAVCTVLETGAISLTESAEREEDPLYPYYKRMMAVCAPLTRGGEVIGTMTLLLRKYKLTREVEFEFVEGLTRLFSTQLELAEVEYQKKLLQKAEFAALQSQINPHFLFNALSTITAFCREKPERARELLIVLSSYFRNTLQTGNYMISLQDELRHVNAYLELEKARFEEKLGIQVEVPVELHCIVPSFTLQPLVENAVKHGAMKRPDGQGLVRIEAQELPEEYRISVCDNGGGLPPAVVEQLASHTLGGQSVGLSNVDKRLRSIYGEEYGLRVDCSALGSRVTIRIPKNSALGGSGEERSEG